MTVEDHVESHPDDYRRVFPVRGKVIKVICKDDPASLNKATTAYQVEVYWQTPSTNKQVLPQQLEYQGFEAAYGLEIPLQVGDMVRVGFYGGDINQPYIETRLRQIDLDTELHQATAEHPKARFLFNGLDFVVDKNGNLTISNYNGDVRLKVTSAGEIQLGGDSGLKALMTEDLIAAYNSHTHTETGGTTSAPISGLLNVGTHATGTVKGK